MQLASMDFGELNVYLGRVNDLAWQMFNSDGETGTDIEVTDVVRCVISRDFCDTPILDLNQTPNSNKSVVNVTARVPAVGTLRLGSNDLKSPQFYEGRYACEFMLVDDSESSPQDANKPFLRGYLMMRPSSGSPTTLP